MKAVWAKKTADERSMVGRTLALHRWGINKNNKSIMSKIIYTGDDGVEVEFAPVVKAEEVATEVAPAEEDTAAAE